VIRGNGWNRCAYLKGEWGRLGEYFTRIKRLFDAHDLLNPEVMCNCRDSTENFRF
jgi:hypothetical protein